MTDHNDQEKPHFPQEGQEQQELRLLPQEERERLFPYDKLGRTLTEQEQQVLLQQELQELQQRRISDGEILSLIEHLGEEQFVAAIATIETLLADEDPLIRETALKSLTRDFSLEKHWETARDFILHDTALPGIDRQAGIRAITYLRQKTGDQQTLAVLAAVVCDATEEHLTRKCAYSAMIEVRDGFSPQQMLIEDERFVLERHADWSMVQSYLDATGRKYLEHRQQIMADEIQEERQTWQKALALIQQGKTPSGGILYYTERFGEKRFFPALEALEHLTHDTDSKVRAAALKALALYFGFPIYWDIASRFLLEDPDEECRIMGAEALSYLQQDTEDRYTLALLARVLNNQREAFPVRQMAYAAFLAVKHYRPSEWYPILNDNYDLEKEVDWTMLQRCLDEV